MYFIYYKVHINIIVNIFLKQVFHRLVPILDTRYLDKVSGQCINESEMDAHGLFLVLL